jgi:hypothetical protein
VRNLIVDPAVEVEINGQSRSARSRVLEGDEAERARSLVFAKYAARYDGDLTAWRQRALPVALDFTRDG